MTVVWIYWFFGTNYRCLLQSSSFQESIAGNPILVTFLPLSKMLIDLSNPSAVGTLVDKVHQERKSNAAKEPRRHPMIWTKGTGDLLPGEVPCWPKWWLEVHRTICLWEIDEVKVMTIEWIGRHGSVKVMPRKTKSVQCPKSSCQLGRKWIGHVIKYGHSIPTALLLQIPFPLTALYPSRRTPTYVLCRISCFQKKNNTVGWSCKK